MKKNLFSFLMLASASAIMFTSCDSSEKTKSTDTMSTMDTTAKMSDQPKMDDKMSEEKGVMVGGANMVASKNIVENAAGSNDHTTLVAAVKAAGLAETLSGAGPFTVFAPTNEAFAKLPAGTVDKLLKPEMKADLTKVLTYHVVPGAMKSSDLKDGQKLKTVEGDELTIGYKDGKWTVTDAKGGVANITIADVISSNGVTYVIDNVLMPKK
ncbi:MAG: fasciclin domain-containing protein [Ferruginibacter sp.]